MVSNALAREGNGKPLASRQQSPSGPSESESGGGCQSGTAIAPGERRRSLAGEGAKWQAYSLHEHDHLSGFSSSSLQHLSELSSSIPLCFSESRASCSLPGSPPAAAPPAGVETQGSSSLGQLAAGGPSAAAGSWRASCSRKTRAAARWASWLYLRLTRPTPACTI
jgi:hypothetical protein